MVRACVPACVHVCASAHASSVGTGACVRICVYERVCVHGCKPGAGYLCVAEEEMRHLYAPPSTPTPQPPPTLLGRDAESWGVRSHLWYSVTHTISSETN